MLLASDFYSGNRLLPLQFQLSPKTGERTFAAAAAAAISIAAARAGTIFARARFVHVQRATIQLFAVGCAHCGFGLFVIVHRDEREAARFAGHPVHHKTDFADGAMLFEQILEIVLGGLKGEIPYV